MKYEIEIPDGMIPKGYEPTGEYRKARRGDRILIEGKVEAWPTTSESENFYLILRKVEPVRESRYGWFTDGGVCTLEEFRRFYPTTRAVRMDLEDGKPVRVELDPAPPLTQ